MVMLNEMKTARFFVSSILEHSTMLHQVETMARILFLNGRDLEQFLATAQ